MDWTTACPDWEERILRGESLIPFDPLFPTEAAAALDVFNQLKIVDAPGSPTMGEAARPWLQDFVASIFGSYDHETGRRLVQEFFLLISKKNNKSTGASGIMMTALLRNWRLSGEFQILAPTIEVANNSFFPARDMIRADDELNDLMQVQEHIRTITHRQTKATLKVVAADSDTVSGKKAIGTLVEELWLFGKRANAENMLREATGGLASRPEGFVVYITTQSDEPPAGVFRQKLQYARAVRDGRIKDKRFLPILYEFPQRMLDDGSYREKSNFYVTNPNLGASVDEEFLQREFDKAVEAGEESVRGFLAKHLNVEIGLALRSDRWRGADFWEGAADPTLAALPEEEKLDALLDRCDVAVIGVDGGGLDDLYGLKVIGRERDTRNWLGWAHAWAHESVLERRKEIAPRLRDFAKAGELTIVKELGEDIDGIVDVVKRVRDRGLLPEKHGVGADQAGIGGTIDALAEEGIVEPQVIGISQGWKLSGAIKTLERKLADGTFLHCGQALMAWAVGNAKVEPKGNAVVITKQVAGTAKIDPLLAALDAATLMSMNPEPPRKAAYQMLIIG